MNKFCSNYLDLNDYGIIVDAVFCNKYIFAITKIDSFYYLIKIELYSDELNASFIINKTSMIPYQITENYSKIYVAYINLKYYIVLTPNINVNNYSPNILIFDDILGTINYQTIIKFDDNFNVGLKNSIEKILINITKESSEYLSLLFVCNIGIYGTNLPLVDFETKNEIILTDTSFSRNIDTSYFDKTKYKDINILNINFNSYNNENYLYISYKETKINGTISSYTKIYKINVSLFGNASIFNIVGTLETPLTSFLYVTENKITYSNNQLLIQVELDLENEEELVKSLIKISNPNLKVNFLEENQFKYVKTNKSTELLASPWNSAGILTIPNNTDLIIIGNGNIENQNQDIEDYKYCLYTFNNKNYLGYVKVQNITFKEEVVIDESKKNCDIISNTAIYSLPTKVLGDTITDTLKSKIVGIITEDSTVEIINFICNYKSNNSIFIKVKVNDSIIGYIESNQIKNLNEMNYYITNNATIKTDNTQIYSKNNTTSLVLHTLNKGTRIKVIGSRDKNTGLTQIEYSDEYGNVYSGYALSDHISTDGWSIMQIIGAILIAINIGILVLIIYFRKKRLNNNDSNFDNNENINDNINN
ncbi:MAG: hypothetical protein IJX17_08140 [Clostridia bacterium]|nr:hypothetical protein [Clostridia bacterium]